MIVFPVQLTKMRPLLILSFVAMAACTHVITILVAGSIVAWVRLIFCPVLRFKAQNPPWLLLLMGPMHVAFNILSLILLCDSSCVWKYCPNWNFAWAMDGLRPFMMSWGSMVSKTSCARGNGLTQKTVLYTRFHNPWGGFFNNVQGVLCGGLTNGLL